MKKDDDDELPWDATPFLPDDGDNLERLRQAAAGCRGCDLYLTGAQTVFGEGPRQADVLFVGEQPGDQEEKLGHPFVGPAGRVLDEALEEVGIDRARVYVTNVVKPGRDRRAGAPWRFVSRDPRARQSH